MYVCCQHVPFTCTLAPMAFGAGVPVHVTLRRSLTRRFPSVEVLRAVKRSPSVTLSSAVAPPLTSHGPPRFRQR